MTEHLPRSSVIAAVLVVFLLPVSTVNAQELPLGTPLFQQKGQLDFEQRKGVASNLLELARVYDRTLPVLTPTEREYVREEEAYLRGETRDSERSTRFVNSIEYKISEARQHLATLMDLLKMIEQQEFRSSDHEIRLWTAVAYHLLSPDL